MDLFESMASNFYAYPNREYIPLSGFDFIGAINLEKYLGSAQEATETRAIFQNLTIDDFKAFLDKGLVEVTAALSSQRSNVPEEGRSIFDEEAARVKKEYTATMFRDYSIANRQIADRIGISPLDWEQQKMRAKYEIEAEKAWQEKMGTVDYEELILNDTIKQSELDQQKIDELGSRFVKLPNIVDNQLNLLRTMAFNGLLEAKMFEEAEKVLIIYENLNDNIKRVLYGENPISMENSF